jgi:hypothetical protein
MSMSVGASASSALSYLQSLLQQGTSGAGDAKKAAASDPLAMLMQAISGDATSPGQTSSSTTSATTGSGATCPPFSPDTMAALLSAQGQQSADGPDAKLFAKLDANGDGTISKDEFSAAASKAGADPSVADAVFAKMDADGDGGVTQSELTKADQATGGHHHHHHVHGGGGGGGAQNPLDAMMASATASGATTQTSTNADGSTTTTISYADGSKVDMTTPAQSASAGSGNKNSANLLEQLIKLQSQVINLATSTMSAVA